MAARSPRFWFPNSLAPAERLYVCALDGNLPTIQDLRSALRRIRGTTLISIPEAEHGGDAWIQDQFKDARLERNGETLRIAFHFPRVWRETQPAAPNNDATPPRRGRYTSGLARWVATTLPARDLPLFDVLRCYPVQYRDASGSRRVLYLEEAAALYELLARVWTLHRLASDSASAATGAPAASARATPASLLQAWRTLPRAIARAVVILRRASRSMPPAGRRMMLARARDLRGRRRELANSIRPTGSGGIALRIPTEQRYAVRAREPEALFARLAALCDARNRGGNIEATPPVPGAPRGKLLIGSTLHPARRMAETTRLLRLRGAQPIAHVDASWLRVGHVDELLAVVPHSGSTRGFAMLRASPQAAILVLEEALHQYQSGLPAGHPHRDGATVGGMGLGLTADGASPLTRLFRGRRWAHLHPPGGGKALEPPNLYQSLARASASQAGPDARPFAPGAGARRLYPAAISVPEILDSGGGLNSKLEREHLLPVEDQLRREFRGVTLLPLPVLFDGPLDARAETHRACVALTPNLVNLQVLSRHLLLARPHGPRMKAPDAARVVSRALERLALRRLASTVTGVLARHGAVLRRTLHWQAGGVPAAQIAAEFRDGFPAMDVAQVAGRLRTANVRRFDARGSVRPGWQRLLIPEDTVDLFELLAAVVARSLGLTPHFVEAWYYHARHGGLHCATNVLRGPMRGSRKR